jgi:uncharacterized repeat protein (TIGR01451 family)
VKAYGTEALQSVSITETGFTGAGTLPAPAYLSGDTNSDNKLDLTETWTFKAVYTLVAADIGTAGVTNSATGSGSVASGTIVTDVSDSNKVTDGNGVATFGPGPNNNDATKTAVPKAPITATNDTQVGVISSIVGTTNAYNVFTNDLLKGIAPTPATAKLAVTAAAAHPGVTLDTATGQVAVAAATPAYTISYQLCEIGNPTNCANATATIVVTAAPAADLVVTKSNGVSGVTTGSTTTYTITATNNGPSSVTGAIVTDTVGTGLTCAPTNAVTVSSGGSYTVADLTGAGITLGTIANGGFVTLSYSCTVN